MSVFSLHDTTFATDSNRKSSHAILETIGEVAGTPIELCIGIHHPEATLADIVPLAWAVSEHICSTIQNDLSQKDHPISCQKGCSDCCYYLVPLSMPEVYYLQDTLKRMSQNSRNQILEKCLESARNILSNKELIDNECSQEQLRRWYAGLNLACPFLNDNTCGFYDQRPLACREHMTTQSSVLCNPQHVEDPVLVTMPASVLESLGQLAAKLEKTEIQAVILPLAILETEDIRKRSQCKWPSGMMVEMFLDILATRFGNQTTKTEALAAG